MLRTGPIRLVVFVAAISGSPALFADGAFGMNRPEVRVGGEAFPHENLWLDAKALLQSAGEDVDALLERAAANFSYWGDNPYRGPTPRSADTLPELLDETDD